MAYTLNTSHALYGNLVELFGVQFGALVSHKTARTFTKHTDATYGTGTYGEHFTALASGYTAKGASFSPYLTLNTSTKPNYTVVAVVNSSGAVQGGTNSAFLSRTASGDTIRSGGKDSSGNAYGYRITGASMGTGARMITYCRIGETSAKLYNNTTLDASSTSLGADYNSPDARADFLCGWDGQNSMTASLVWLAVFDKELTLAEITDLYNSLGANNAFGLVQSSGGSASTAISATLANITGSVASKSNPKTAISATLSNVTASVGHTTGTLKTTITATLGNVVGAITSTGNTTNGTFTSEVLKDYAGNVLANTALNFVRFYNDTTGALVLNKTGVSTNGSGIVTFSDAALVAGTTYRVDWETTAGSRRMPRKAAT